MRGFSPAVTGRPKGLHYDRFLLKACTTTKYCLDSERDPEQRVGLHAATDELDGARQSGSRMA